MSKFELEIAQTLGNVEGLLTGLDQRMGRLEEVQDTIFEKLDKLPTIDHEVRLTKLEAKKSGVATPGMSKKQTSLFFGLTIGVYEGLRAIIARKLGGGG